MLKLSSKLITNTDAYTREIKRGKKRTKHFWKMENSIHPLEIIKNNKYMIIHGYF